MESDVDVSTPMENGRLEENNEMLHKTIKNLSLHKYNIWCSNCWEEGHKKYTCKHQTIWIIQTNNLCEIVWEVASHLTKDYPYNLRNQKKYWWAICKESSHNTTNCELNSKNYWSVYKTEVIPND